MRIALDTNVLIYAEGIDDAAKETVATSLTSALTADTTFLPVQVLGELFNVLVRRGRSREQARQAVRGWEETFPLVPTTQVLMSSAVDLAVQHKLKIWDALILAAAAEAGCGLLLSEDYQDGFQWSGVTVANPFEMPHHPLLADVLRK
jgi:predicted nucleic acid-binding protein